MGATVPMFPAGRDRDEEEVTCIERDGEMGKGHHRKTGTGRLQDIQTSTS